MFKTALVAAGALVAVTATSLPSKAASIGFSIGITGTQGGIHLSAPGYRAPGHLRQRHVLPPRAVTLRLHQQGFQRVHWIQRRGNVYMAQARQRWGQRVLVTADARTGRVINVRRIG